MNPTSENQLKKLFEPVPAHADFDELIATADDPEKDFMHYAYVRTKCGAFFKCDVTWQHGSWLFGIVRWKSCVPEQVLAEAFTFPPENWRWHHEPIMGNTRKENHQFLKDMVHWCLNRVHKLGLQKLKPGWRIEHPQDVRSQHNPLAMQEISLEDPLIVHGLCGPDTPGKNLPPDPDDRPSLEDDRLPPLDGQPRTTGDVHGPFALDSDSATQGS